MLTLIQNVEFKKDRNEFQKELSQDLTQIRTNDKLLIAADKLTNFDLLPTTNFYRLDTLCLQQITRHYYNQSLQESTTEYRMQNNIRREESS